MRYFSDKYSQDLFYIVPFFHQEIPAQIKKLIAIDIDIHLRCWKTWKYWWTPHYFLFSRIDFQELYDFFDKFSKTHLIGVANERYPQYYFQTHIYRTKNPETLVGSLGKYQVSSSLFIIYHPVFIFCKIHNKAKLFSNA